MGQHRYNSRTGYAAALTSACVRRQKRIEREAREARDRERELRRCTWVSYFLGLGSGILFLGIAALIVTGR